MSEPRTTPAPGRTPAWRYAIGMLGTSIPINMIKGSMILYYVDILGLDVRAYGVVMVIYAVIDAVDNPLLGHLSDRTRSRFGRRRPWLLVGAPMLVACMIAFFSAPSSLRGMGLVLWFAVFAILCEAFDSMINANYGALLPELYPRERDRAVANGLRQGFQLVALVLSLAVTPLLTTSVFGTEESTGGFRTTAIIYGAVALVVIAFMALSARER
ncbi:MFS transporter, partial [Nonomuraea fuscirosea]